MKRIVSFILTLSMLLSLMTPFVSAHEGLADIAGDYIDKTANGLNEADQTDVTLTVPGAVEGYIDVVFILGGGMTANMETIESAINVFKPAMESGKATVRMGILSLEKGKELILDLNSDEAVLDPATYVDFVTEKFDSINDLPYGSTNLHSQLVEAQKMLAKETKAKAENKYVFVLATGRTYWFDDANGEQATIVNKVNGTYYWGNYLWQSQRGGNTSLYMIPAGYNNSYAKFFADIEKWVAADGNKYEYSPHFDVNDYSAYVNWEQANNKDLKALGVAGSRYGNGIVNPKPTADNFITGTMAAVGSGSNPQNALNYERAQYECVQVWKELVANGYNCYSICSEAPNYQNGSVNIKSKGYTGSSTIQVGHAFMDYLAELAGHGKAPVVWEYQRDENGNVVFYPGKEGNYNYAYTTIRENFFDSVREDMLHTCSTGSTVVDYIGKNENGNFEFIENANYIKLVVGGDEYTTTVATTAKHVDKNGEEAKSSYAFTAPGADGPTFWLDYFYGDGKTTERFVWTFGESVSVERIASLTYKLQLTEKRKEAGRYTVPTNNSATLYPVDSDGNPGDPVLFPVPEVEYIVLPDENYDDPDNFDKSKTATDLYDDRYTDVTLSIPGEVEDLATDIVFVIDKSSSDKLSSGFANELFAQLMAVKRSSGARINVGVVIFNYKAHKQLDLIELNENNYQNLLDSLPTLSGGTNADAGLTMAKKMLDAHDDVDASRKHVIFISDGLSWVFEKDGVQYTVLNKVQSGNSWKNLYGVGTQPYLTLRANESWKIPAQFGTWDAFWSNIKTLVENDRAAGDKWLFEMTNHRGEDPTKPKPADLVNTEEALAVSVPKTEIDKHALNVERALYETWESYEALQNAGYNCNSYYTGAANTIGEDFMQMLAGSSSMKFEDIKHDILYSVSKGSKVVDYIGYSNDPVEGYNFDFIDKIGEELKLPVLKVGSITYFTKKLETSVNGATASYVFSATENGEATFAMDYYRGNGTTTEHFVWTINENVSRFAPVSLTYTLDLVERSEIPGLHEDVDTNQIAVLYPKDSDGNDGPPEEFEKPKVEYEIPKKHVELEGDKISENIGNHKFQVTVQVPGGDGVKTHDEFILMVDGSYSGDSEWPKMKEAINSIGEAVLDGSGQTQLTLMAFGMGDNIVLEHIKDAEELAKALGELPGNLLRGVSSTNCEAGFTGVAEYIENHDDTLKEAIVVYITDGGINTDETPKAFYNWTQYAPNINNVIKYALAGMDLPEGITQAEKIALVNDLWKDVFELSNMDINGKYPISEMERAFLVYAEDPANTNGWNVYYSFLLAMKNSSYDKYPDVWNRTYNSVFDLAKVGKVKDLYLVRYQNKTKASWMPQAAELSQIDKIKYVKSDSISTLTDALKDAISDFAKHPYNNVVVTDYMSKWVILDPETIKVVDAYGNVVAEFDPENSPKDADGNYTSYVYKWVGEPLCKDGKAPIIVELVPESEYAAGGPEVVGNANGPIHRITWNLKDGPLTRTDVYTLQYEVFVNTEEPGFEYNKDYPSNGNTYAEYTDDDDNEHKVDIKVPDVDAEEIFTSVSGEKTWNDANNQDGKRPASITINLLANGKEIKDVKVTADKNGNWTYSFENLPKYENGKEITYTITEDEVEGYTTTIDGFNVTNTYTPETVKVSGNKTWNDNNNQDGVRPASITINLLANGKEIKDVKVTADKNGNWTYSFENLPKYENGKEITYTITEDEVEGYTTTIDGFNVTNTYTPETITVSGNKTWNDNNNQDGIRPESITINLLANGKVVDSVVVTAKDGWAWSFENLDKFAAGEEITYTITEDAVEGYTTTINGFNVTNTHIPETIKVSGNKTWNDNNNQDGIRPESITINLLANGKVVDSVVVTAKDGWAWSFENLDKFAAGEEITYTITEDAVEGYTTAIDGFNVTNTHIPETIKVSGNKTWNDKNNQDGIRPESITINLLANGKVVDSVVVTAKDGWAWSFENLDKFAAGKEITYTITEDAVEGYTTTIDGFNVTNTHIPETIKVSGNKTWNDANNQDGKRPESITINLLANGKEIKDVKVTADKNGNWTYSFENLPKYENGKEITYTITEDEVEGYTTTIDGFNVTNTHIPETIKVSGNKTWNDKNNQDGIRPESITINLLANGKVVDSVVVTAKDGWTWSFENLDKFAAGEEITYTITENKVSGYTTEIDGFNVTNTHIPETIKVSGNKTWNDKNNQDGIRPESITINLLANGKVVDSVVVTAKDGWAWSFENLDKFAAGKEITYTITEDAVEGYTTTIDGFNVTNTHIPETIKVSGNKTWNDKNNQDGIRPESITINLLANGKVVDSVVVTAKDGWAWSFENLDKFAAGKEITYTITEDAVEGYTTTIDGFNVTNTHIPETIKVSGNKTWNDKNNQDGIRPESITINLLANGKVVDSVVVTAKDGWAWSFENLDKFAAGKEITYTITENKVSGYTTEIDGFNVTNTHIPETVKVSGNKTWVDKNNQDGKRPASITINLLANGKVVDSVVVTAKDGWAWSFEDLDKFAAGEEIVYSITEDTVKDYSTTYNGFNVTNTYVPETTAVSGIKTWNDNNNQDGIRPESITINLLANGKVVDSVVVTAENGWAWNFANLDKFAAGAEIVYSIEEVAVEGYTTTYEGFNVINTHIPETTEVSGNKTWNDNNNQDGIRPESITINLLANGKVVDSVVVTAEDGWAWNFANLDKFAAGAEIVYSIEEVAVEGYTTTYEGFNVINTHVPETIAVSGNKTWNDNNNQDGIRPKSITINLLANGKVVDSVVVTAEDGWAWNFANLDKFAAGAEIVYSIEEVAVEGYTTTYEGFNVINTHVPETIAVSGNKTWNDNNNQDGIRPESITINLLANGKVVDSVVVTAEDGWSWSFANLDKFAASAEIVYSIEEVAVEGYTTTYEGFNVINTHIPETTEVSGNKTWKDANDKDGIRPESITINLLANGKVVDSVVVTAEDGWSWSFANLDKFAAGAEIVYSIEEVAVEGYTTTYEGFNVINTHVPETKLDLSGIKYLDGEAAEGFTFVLVDAEGNVIGTVESGADGKFAFATLVYTEEGTHVYFIKEVVGDDEDIIYDTSVYMATVTVTKEGEELKASCVLAKDEVSHEGAIEFYNETIVEIPDNPPPLDDIPQTGDNNVENVFLIAVMVVALGVIVKSKRRRFE